MYSINEIGWEELIRDGEIIGNYYKPAKGASFVRINDDRELKELADEIVFSLRKLGWEQRYGSIAFGTLVKPKGGTAGWGGDIIISDFYKGNDYNFCMIPVHEIVHTSGTHDETETEFLSMEQGASLLLSGDKRFASEFYHRLHDLVNMTCQLKARKEGIPEEYSKAVEEITHIPTKKSQGKGKVELDYGVFNENVFTHDNEGKCDHWYVENDDLYRYGFLTYSLLKDAIKNGRESVSVNGKEFGIKNALKALECLW